MGAGGRDEREARKVLGLEAGAGLKEVRKRFADLSKQLHPDKVADEEKKVAATAKWVAVKAAYDLLRELALARPGGGGKPPPARSPAPGRGRWRTSSRTRTRTDPGGRNPGWGGQGGESRGGIILLPQNKILFHPNLPFYLKESLGGEYDKIRRLGEPGFG